VIYVPDTLEDERFQQDTSGTRSLMAVPLTVQDRVIGALSIESAQPNAFTPNHERVLIITGSQIAATIESVRHAHALAAANAQLEAQDKLRRELLIQVSHDLRSPLTLVQGYAGLLADQAFGPISPEQVEYLNIIEQRAQSIQRLTEDILSTRPIDTSLLELAPLDITQLSEQAIADARIVFASSNMAFTTDLAPGEFVVEGDEARLNRVYYNLISNAVKFSPEGGVITLSTRHDAEGGRILVSITDQGIGIQPDKLPHIFERFFRGDKEFRSRFDGSGVGLYNVKQIVEAHHGAVWGESEVGVGSTLTFALPLAVQPTGER
jgi:signal transduction histidine kinase